MTDWNPEPHNLLTVRAIEEIGAPACNPTCLAK